MSGISTHVLDLAKGKPVAGIPVVLMQWHGESWIELAYKSTDLDGRAKFSDESEEIMPGTYRLIFRMNDYPGTNLYPEIVLTFKTTERDENYHLPVLISPNGYTTYRGS